MDYLFLTDTLLDERLERLPADTVAVMDPDAGCYVIYEPGTDREYLESQFPGCSILQGPTWNKVN